MNKPKFTPGPWVCASGMVWKPTDEWDRHTLEGGIPIAIMDRQISNGTVPVERDANARLIAAAPDLLEALQNIAEMGCCETPGCSIDNPICEVMVARAAVYEATK